MYKSLVCNPTSINEAFFNRNVSFPKIKLDHVRYLYKENQNHNIKIKTKKSADIGNTLLAKMYSTTKGLGCQ